MTETSEFGGMATQMIVRFGTHFNIRLGEWGIAIVSVSIAWLMLANPGMFERSPTYFAGMIQFGSERLWGVIFGLFGLIRLVALYINGRKPITPYIRMALAFLSCFAWYQINISLFASGVPGLGWAVFPWLLALEMYNVFRSAADAREVFDKQRAARNEGTD